MVQIAVVGAGCMGIKIAGEFAYHGHKVNIYDVDAAALNKVHVTLEDDRKLLCADGLLPEKHFLGPVFCMSRLEETVRNADFIFEVIIEDLELKKDIFERISHCCKESAIISSNTLRLDINLINERAVNKQRTLGLRFLFPVYYIPEIEILPAKQTDIAVIEKVRTLIEKMGKTLFFRSGQHPLVLNEKQREERKAARLREIQLSSETGTYLQRIVPTLKNAVSGSVLKSQKEDTEEMQGYLDRDCAICMDRQRDCLFTPCHHMVTCYECGDILQARRDACPICRKEIDKAVKVYHT